MTVLASAERRSRAWDRSFPLRPGFSPSIAAFLEGFIPSTVPLLGSCIPSTVSQRPGFIPSTVRIGVRRQLLGGEVSLEHVVLLSRDCTAVRPASGSGASLNRTPGGAVAGRPECPEGRAVVPERVLPAAMVPERELPAAVVPERELPAALKDGHQSPFCPDQVESLWPEGGGGCCCCCGGEGAAALPIPNKFHAQPPWDDAAGRCGASSLELLEGVGHCQHSPHVTT